MPVMPIAVMALISFRNVRRVLMVGPPRPAFCLRMGGRRQGEVAMEKKRSRRRFLKQGAVLLSGAGMAQGAASQERAGEPWERVYGAGFRGYGQPSRFEQPVQRYVFRPYGDLAPGSGAALAPIEQFEGIITPSSLHNERSHSGVPDIDPKVHRVLVHGLVARPLTFTVESLSRYPMTTRIHFLECSGNSNRALAPQPMQVPAGAMH